MQPSHPDGVGGVILEVVKEGGVVLEVVKEGGVVLAVVVLVLVVVVFGAVVDCRVGESGINSELRYISNAATPSCSPTYSDEWEFVCAIL